MAFLNICGRLRDRQSEWSCNRTSDLKIGKNVNKTEIDHISAYLCGHKLSELLIRHFNDKIGRENRNNLYFKVSEKKWRLFCFVLTTSSDFRRATFAVAVDINVHTIFFGSSIDVVFTVASSSDLKNVFTVASSSDFRRATFVGQPSSTTLIEDDLWCSSGH